MIFGKFWSIDEHSFNLMLEQVRAGLESFYKIAAGPVDDAERSGLPTKKVGNVAIIRLNGPMIRGNSMFARFFGLASTDAVRMAFKSAQMDADVEKILFIVSSPGGSVDGLAELADTMSSIKQSKPIITQVEGQMASAALYVGAQSTEIYAGRNDLIGSIGTRLMLYDFSEAFKKAGIKAVPIDTGEFKSAGAMGTEITDRQKADFQRIVDAFYEDFLQAVETGRGMDRKALEKIADGRMFLASEARDHGLIDGIRSLDETIASIVTSERPRGRHTASAAARLNLI